MKICTIYSWRQKSVPRYEEKGGEVHFMSYLFFPFSGAADLVRNLLDHGVHSVQPDPHCHTYCKHIQPQSLPPQPTTPPSALQLQKADFVASCNWRFSQKVDEQWTGNCCWN